MKKIVVLLGIVFFSVALNAQIKNTFIQKGRLVFYPEFSWIFDGIHQKSFGLGAELGYLPVNKLEFNTGVTHFFGYHRYTSFDIGSRYYLLSSKLTIFPELNYSLLYNYKTNELKHFYEIGVGVGYYGIFKRIGVDLMAKYSIGEYNFFYPDIKIKILLGKIDKE